MRVRPEVQASIDLLSLRQLTQAERVATRLWDDGHDEHGLAILDAYRTTIIGRLDGSREQTSWGSSPKQGRP